MDGVKLCWRRTSFWKSWVAYLIAFALWQPRVGRTPCAWLRRWSLLCLPCQGHPLSPSPLSPFALGWRCM